MKLQIIAFDPGITTGYALVDSELGVLETAELTSSQVISGEFTSSLPTWPCDCVVEEIQIPTRSKMNRELLLVYESLKHYLGKDITLIPPGVWKNSAAATRQCPEGVSIHESDACRLAYYYLSTLERNAV